MLRSLVATLLLVLIASCAFGATLSSKTEVIDKLSLFKTVEASDIVVASDVVAMKYVYCEIISKGMTTDIVFRIRDLIKGPPNYGSNHVIFCMEGA